MIKHDPLILAIQRHKAAYAALCALPDGSADEERVTEACIDAEQAMLATIPTTPVGLRALVEYADARLHGYDGIPFQYFPAILAACRAVLPAEGGAR